MYIYYGVITNLSSFMCRRTPPPSDKSENKSFLARGFLISTFINQKKPISSVLMVGWVTK